MPTSVKTLTGRYKTGQATPVSAQDDEEIEPVYATSKILKQRGPKLGRFGLQPMLKLLYPGLRKLPWASKLPDDDDREVIDQVIGKRGRFLIRNEANSTAGKTTVTKTILLETLMTAFETYLLFSYETVDTPTLKTNRLWEV